MALFEARKARVDGFDVGLDLCIATQVRAHAQVFFNGHPREDAAAFRHHDQALRHQLPSALPFDGAPLIAHLTACGLQQATDGLECGGLAGAVGTDQTDQLARVQIQTQVLDSLNATVRHIQLPNRQQGLTHHIPRHGVHAVGTA